MLPLLPGGRKQLSEVLSLQRLCAVRRTPPGTPQPGSVVLHTVHAVGTPKRVVLDGECKVYECTLYAVGVERDIPGLPRG